MYKNQLQELAQRSCFNLPSYTCMREGPDHAPRFKAIVNFNGETFESPTFCTTLRQAEHAAAEVALNSLFNRGPSHSLAARILDETGVYKNLLQEVSQRVGASLPLYTTIRSGLGHLPVFSCTVELAGIAFTGVPGKTKKQAEKNAAMAAWLILKQLAQESSGSSSVTMNSDEQEHVTVARALQNYLTKLKAANSSFPLKFPAQTLQPPKRRPPLVATSKILPLIHPRSTSEIRSSPTNKHSLISQSSVSETFHVRPRFPAAEAEPYFPIRHLRACHGIAPPVTVRNAMPVYSAPVHPSSTVHSVEMNPQLSSVAPPPRIRQAVQVYTGLPVAEVPVSHGSISTQTVPSALVEDGGS
ncbi:Double-stranded RNA-binding protein 6 [Ancistrocladus abbreviatus]